MTLTLCLYLYLCLIALFLPSQQFFIVVELNRTRYGVKFLNENLIFCPLQDEPSSKRASSSDTCTREVLDERSQTDIPITEWSIQYPYQETQLHPGEYSGPPYDAVDPSIKLQEGYNQNPSTTTGQTILSSSENLERKGSFDSFNPSNLSYPQKSINTSLIEDYLQPNYSQFTYPSQLYTEQIDSFDSSFVQNGNFNGFEFFYDSPCTCMDTTNVHR